MTMILTECECGREVTLNEVPQPLRFYVVMAALMVHASTVHTLMELPEYELAKPGWDERFDTLTNTLDSEAQEMAMFGEAFDEEDDDGAQEG